MSQGPASSPTATPAPPRIVQIRAAPTATANPAAKPAGITIFKAKDTLRPFPNKDLIKFYRGMASMLRAQINTGDALKFYAHGLPNKDMAFTLLQIQESIAAGMNVHEAFRKSNRFDAMTIGLLHAGADAGQLDKAFSSLAHRIKTDMYFKSKVKKATIVPCLVITVLIGAFIFSQVKIVPQVEDMLASVKMEPDPFSKILFKLSHVVQAIWPAVVLLILGSVITLWKSVRARNATTNFIMSKWRLFRQLIMGMRQLTFLGTMHMLHSNGINLTKAIRVAAETVRSTPLYDELITAADRYQHAALPVAEAFRKFTSCDAQIGHMLDIGEKTASIDAQLELLAQMYEEDTANYMEDFTQLLSLIVVLCAVSIIGAIFIGTYLPIFLMGPRMMNSRL